MRLALIAYGIILPLAVGAYMMTCVGCGEHLPLAVFIGAASLFSFWAAYHA